MNSSLYIEKMLTDTLGLDLESMGKGFLERTMKSLLKKSGSSSLEDYVARLKSSREETEKIIEAVVVPETWFFRDHGPFDYLKYYLMDQGKQKTSKEKTRILSVPCSTGEEPYSIVMTLLEAGMSPKEFTVDAVDLSENALKVAREGRYGKGSFRGMTEEMGRSYFHQEERNVRISERVISEVRFYRDNLLRPELMTQMSVYHVIFCRNLLIYLNRKAKDAAFFHIDRMLRPGGLLIAGHAEVLFWRQRGYLLVDHPRSFALRKPTGEDERSTAPSLPPALGVGGTHLRRVSKDGGCLRTEGKSPIIFAPPADFKKHDRESGDDKITKASEGYLKNGGKASQEQIRKRIDYVSPINFLIRARSLADRGEMEEALSICRKYLEADPPCAEVYYLMGLIHESRERTGEAEECYLKALYLDPDHLETIIHARLMYERRHDHEKANLLKSRLTRIEGQRQNNGR